MATLPAAEIRRAVRQGLEEDLAQGDATTASIFPSPVPACAEIIAQQLLVVAGMAAAVQTFLMVDPSLRLSVLKRDGQRAKNGDPLLLIEGDGRSILRTERVALNEATVWTGGPYDPNQPAGHQALPEIRKLIFDGQLA